MDYALLKAVHVTCVGVTLALFFGRGLLMLADSPLLGTRLLRVARTWSTRCSWRARSGWR